MADEEKVMLRSVRMMWKGEGERSEEEEEEGPWLYIEREAGRKEAKKLLLRAKVRGRSVKRKEKKKKRKAGTICGLNREKERGEPFPCAMATMERNAGEARTCGAVVDLPQPPSDATVLQLRQTGDALTSCTCLFHWAR